MLSDKQAEVLTRFLAPDSGATENERKIAKMLLDARQTSEEIAAVNPATIAYFCGVWGGKTERGHYCYLPGGVRERTPKHVTPWGSGQWGAVTDSGLCKAMQPEARNAYDYDRDKQVEGVRYHFRQAGWTLVCWWDRSADPRHGCVAGFALYGSYSADQAESEARRLFPSIFQRMDLHLGRTTEDAILRERVIAALALANADQWRAVAAALNLR